MCALEVNSIYRYTVQCTHVSKLSLLMKETFTGNLLQELPDLAFSGPPKIWPFLTGWPRNFLEFIK